MRYTLLIKKQAKEALQSAPHPARIRITEKIVLLGENPDNTSLDIKKLQDEPYFRLRVGQWRMLFDIDNEVKIKPRGGAYKKIITVGRRIECLANLGSGLRSDLSFGCWRCRLSRY